MAITTTHKRGTVDLLHGPIMKSIFLFVIPVFISNLFQQMYNTADTMIVGHYLGESSLAAVGAGSPIYDMLISFSMGIGNGMALVTGRCFGSGDRDKLKRSIATALLLGLCTSILLTLIAQFGAYPLLKMLNTPKEILEEARSYVCTITLFITIMLAYNLCSGILRAVGNSVMPLVFLIVSSVLNIILDILFISRFDMGVRGAAIATVMAQGTSVILCLIYVFKCCKELIPQKKHFQIDKNLLQDMFTQGLSMGIMSGLVSSGTVILQSGINTLGYLTIAGHTAARKVYLFFNIAFISMATGISNFVSQNRGADQPDRIRNAVRKVILFDITVAAVLTVVLHFTAPALIQFVSGSSEEMIIHNGSRYLWVLAPFYAVLGPLFVLRFSLQAIGIKILPLFSSLIEFVAKIIFAWFMIPRFGYTAVIFCEPVIWCLMILELAPAFYLNPYIKNAASSNRHLN